MLILEWPLLMRLVLIVWTPDLQIIVTAFIVGIALNPVLDSLA